MTDARRDASADDELARLRAALAEKTAVVQRIKEYVGVWTQDKRMRVMGEIVLREIERIEREEAARSREAA